ncbi:MAG TPA: hypothetical protein VIM73_00465 [Polyangiaceae bacterium]
MTADRANTRDDLEIALLELEALHGRESSILRTMDHAALDAITSEKDALCSHVRELMSRTKPAPHHRAVLERLRRQATLNQLLIVHARDAVRTILSEASGAPPIEAPLRGSRMPVVQDGLRVNVRG